MRRLLLALSAILIFSSGAYTATSIVQTPHGGTGIGSYTAGGILVGNSGTTLSQLAIGSDNQVLTANSGATNGIDWETLSTVGGGQLVYGDGFDGALHLDGVSAVAGFTLAGSTYTQNRPVYATTFLEDVGVTVKIVNQQIYARTSITVNGTIQCDGANGSGATGGAAATVGLYAGGGAGGNGNVNAAGSTGIISQAGLGGTAGNGGAGTFSGGAGGAVTVPPNNVGGISVFHTMWVSIGNSGGTGYALQLTAGAGGGGGGGSVSTAGGAGGAGGGILFLASPSISGSGTLSSIGGNGAGSSAANTGTGGGGEGGTIVTISDTAPTVSMITVAGGSPGAASGGATAGTAGSTGFTVNILNK